MFSGKASDRTSEKVQSFFYEIHKYWSLCDYSQKKMLALAECCLQDKAATCITRLEHNSVTPNTLEEPRTAMSQEFVPSNEIAEARIKLMEIKRNEYVKLQDFISKFEDLIMLCGTPPNEAYIYFFNSLPRTMKGKFTGEISYITTNRSLRQSKHASSFWLCSHKWTVYENEWWSWEDITKESALWRKAR